MLGEFLLYLPCSISLVLMLVFGICGKQTRFYGQIMLLLLVCVVYFFTDSCYASSNSDYTTLAYTTLLGQMVTPCLLPLSWLYLMNLQGKKPGHAMSTFWIIAPVFLFSSALLLHFLIGTDNEIIYLGINDQTLQSNVEAFKMDRMYQLSYFFKATVFRIVLLFEVLVMVFFIINNAVKTKFSLRKFRSFLSDGGAMSPFHIQMGLFSALIVVVIAKILFQRAFLLQHQWVAVVLSLILSGFVLMIGIVAMFSSWDEVCLSDMIFNMPRSYGDDAQEILDAVKVKGMSNEAVQQQPVAAAVEVEAAETPTEQATEQVEEVQEPEEESKEHSGTGLQIKAPLVSSTQTGMFANQGETTVNTVLLGRFEDLIINRQMFLTPGITLNDIASKLSTNRTYISQLVNDNYHMPFPELLNNLRIDYAEQYILHNREAKQNEVAQACGFPSASSFNVTFKKITGVTPKIWLATYADNK